MAQLADPAAVQRLMALRNAPITVLAAFAIAMTDLVAPQYIRAVTGLSQDTIGPTLERLANMGFVEVVVKRYSYRLTPEGQRLTAGLALLLGSDPRPPAPEQLELGQGNPQKSDSHVPAPPARSPINSVSHNQIGHSEEGFLGQFPPSHGESEKIGLPAPSSSSLDIENTDGAIFEQFKIALASAGVHHQLRRPLAKALIAEDGPGWLRHVLGWIAHTTAEGATSPPKRGPTIWPALSDRDRCEDIYLPPAGMNFAQALAWAERGAQQQPAAAAPAADTFQDDALAIPEHERLWRQVLERIEQQLPPGAQASMLNNTALAPGAEPNQYTIICPNTWTRDWLATRMASAIQRELNTAAGAAVALTFRTSD